MSTMTKPLSDWIVNTLGNHEHYEISVVRKDFAHGLRSWGWDTDDAKIILMSRQRPQHEPPPPWLKGYMQHCAQIMADRLNDEDRELERPGP